MATTGRAETACFKADLILNIEKSKQNFSSDLNFKSGIHTFTYYGNQQCLKILSSIRIP